MTGPLGHRSRVDLEAYHASVPEQLRVADLMSLVPDQVETALDIGARDGHITRLLAKRVRSVVALDLALPNIKAPGVTCVEGNAADLPFSDESFDLVMCAEVLEHIPEPHLQAACKEISRVTRGHALIGVPYRQDIRVGRCTCQSCKKISPPWGHVNSFDEDRLASLFPGMPVESTHFVGEADTGTNALAATLMDWAGNPYGSYGQDETCTHCGAELRPPPPRTWLQRALTRAATVARAATGNLERPKGNWIHLRLGKTRA